MNPEERVRRLKNSITDIAGREPRAVVMNEKFFAIWHSYCQYYDKDYKQCVGLQVMLRREGAASISVLL